MPGPAEELADARLADVAAHHGEPGDAPRELRVEGEGARQVRQRADRDELEAGHLAGQAHDRLGRRLVEDRRVGALRAAPGPRSRATTKRSLRSSASSSPTKTGTSPRPAMPSSRAAAAARRRAMRATQLTATRRSSGDASATPSASASSTSDPMSVSSRTGRMFRERTGRSSRDETKLLSPSLSRRGGDGEEGGAGVDGVAFADGDLGDDAVDRRGDRVLHLHGLDDHDGLTGARRRRRRRPRSSRSCPACRR